MPFSRARSIRTGIALALLVSVGLLLGLSAAAHSHDTGVSPGDCEVCRLASAAVPILVVLFSLLLTLAESRPALLPLPEFRAQATRRRLRSRGPPLV